jgi:hypothetical protein
MCFAPEADLIGGVVVSGVGVDALRQVRHRREVAVAALPVLFGTHQIIEAFAWWGLEGAVPAAFGDVATYIYLGIALVLPVLVPLAVLSIEPDARRRRTVVPFVILGAAVAVTLLINLVSGPVTAEVAGLYIEYDVNLEFGGQITALYVAATCGPLLLSTNRRLVVFGILNLAAVSVLAWLMASGVISLWCAWAAVASVVIVIHLRTAERAEVPAAVSARAGRRAR